MNYFLTVIIGILLTSCNQPRQWNETKTLDFGAFTIETPTTWEKIKVKGIDSYVGRIAIDDKDTIDFDLGWYSSTLTEYEPQIIERALLQHLKPPIDTTEFIIVDSREGIDPDKFKKNNVSWGTIDGRKAKIVYPRRHGIGTTGVYIDSLWVSGIDVHRFNLSGENLQPENEVMVLKAIKTLKFRDK